MGKRLIILVIKKKDRKDCKNYRRIMLMCNCRKMYKKIKESRIREVVGEI